MADFPLFGGVKTIASGLNLLDTTGTDLTASATPHTKGVYVELLSAANNTEESTTIEVVQLTRLQVYTLFLVDVAIGDVGSEQVIIPNLAMYTNAQTAVWASSTSIKLPINIPSGVRISARCQSLTASAVVSVFIRRYISDFKQRASLSKVTDYGTNLTTSRGVEVTAGGDAYGSWAEIVASTTEEIQTLGVSATRDPVSLRTGNIVYQIGVGSAGNEEVLVDGLAFSTNTSEIIMGYLTGCHDVSVPAGSRLSIRSASLLTNIDFDFSYIIYGVS